MRVSGTGWSRRAMLLANLKGSGLPYQLATAWRPPRTPSPGQSILARRGHRPAAVHPTYEGRPISGYTNEGGGSGPGSPGYTGSASVYASEGGIYAGNAYGPPAAAPDRPAPHFTPDVST